MGVEMSRHMALIGKACRDSRLGERDPVGDPGANPKKTPGNEIAVRGGAELRAEGASA